jgi:hypothetical protein
MKMEQFICKTGVVLLIPEEYGVITSLVYMDDDLHFTTSKGEAGILWDDGTGNIAAHIL